MEMSSKQVDVLIYTNVGRLTGDKDGNINCIGGH